MANASIGGLVSGLDTATIISQLMQLEARPQANLKSRVSSEQRAVTALQTLNSKLANIATKAAELAKTDSWLPMKATSSNAGVTVSADSTAQLTSLDLNIVSTATAAREVFATPLARAADAVTAGAITIDFDDAAKADLQIDLTDGTLDGLAAAINASDAGLKATLVRAGGTDAAPTYSLHVVNTQTGADSGFTIYEGDPSLKTTEILGGSTRVIDTGTDAQITVGGQTITSTSNTFSDLMPGVDVTLAVDAKDSATITVARDTDALSGKLKSLVDVVNLAMDEISSLTKTSGEAKERGLLSGDSTLRGIRSQLLETVTGGINLQSLEPYGIETDRSGKLVFDETKFKAAYDADPTATTAMFVTSSDPAKDDGFAGAVSALAKGFSDSIDGTVTSAIKSRQSQIKGWEDDIADWDIRLATKQTALQRQYTALESALGKLQSQGNWLAGQIAGLPKMSSGQ
ncbi:MAG: flagellar filament capping protein FliD [Actinomycetota bacterium]